MKSKTLSKPLLAVSVGILMAGCQTNQPEPVVHSEKDPVTAEAKPASSSKPKQSDYQPKAPTPAPATEVAQPAPTTPPEPEPAPKSSALTNYPIANCIVSGETLGDDAHSFIYLGQTYFVRSAAEEETFRSSSADYIAKYQEALEGGSAGAGPSSIPEGYALTTCVVCGQELGNDAHTFIYLGETIVVASPDHEATFRENPGEYLEKLRNASN